MEWCKLQLCWIFPQDHCCLYCKTQVLMNQMTEKSVLTNGCKNVKKLLIDFCCEHVKASNPSANTVQGSVSNCDMICSSSTTTTACSSSVLSGAMSIKLQLLQEIQGAYASTNNIQQAVTSDVEAYFNL